MGKGFEFGEETASCVKGFGALSNGLCAKCTWRPESKRERRGAEAAIPIQLGFA